MDLSRFLEIELDDLRVWQGGAQRSGKAGIGEEIVRALRARPAQYMPSLEKALEEVTSSSVYQMVSCANSCSMTSALSSGCRTAVANVRTCPVSFPLVFQLAHIWTLVG